MPYRKQSERLITIKFNNVLMSDSDSCFVVQLWDHQTQTSLETLMCDKLRGRNVVDVPIFCRRPVAVRITAIGYGHAQYVEVIRDVLPFHNAVTIEVNAKIDPVCHYPLICWV